MVWSASDLKAAAECEFAWLRGIDARIGRITAVEEPEDATLERAGRLGGEHELRVLAGYRATYGDGVVEIAETSSANAEGLAEAVARTREALASDADVIYQAAFATHEFVGFADFLVRDEVGRWIVQDSKLARRARVTALMQLSAYVDQLDRLGVARSDRVELLLGDGTVSVHIADELLPVFALRRARLRALIDDRRLDLGLAWPAIAWGDPRGDLGVVACGRCATCDSEVVAARDLLLVAGMRPVQRDRLRTSGITTIDQLAHAPTAPSRMSPDTFGMLRTQARLQLSAPAGTGAAVDVARVAPGDRRPSRSWRPRRSARCLARMRATCSSTSRATRSTPRAMRRSGASTTSSAGSTSASSTARSGRTPSTRSAPRSRRSSTSFRCTAAGTRTSTSITTRRTSRRTC